MTTVLSVSGKNLVEPVSARARATAATSIRRHCTIGIMPICWRSMRGNLAKAI